MDLSPEALDLEKLIALVAKSLDVAPFELQLVLITTGKHTSSFWVVAQQNGVAYLRDDLSWQRNNAILEEWH